MGARVMNSDYESEELHSLDESSFDSAHDDDDHRTAVEIDNSVRKNHPSVLIRDLFWKAVKATYQQEHEKAMNELKKKLIKMHISGCRPNQQLSGLCRCSVGMVKVTQCLTTCVKASTAGFLSLEASQ